MHYHCGTNKRAPRWTFTNPCKPEVRPGAREESASPAWLAAPAMNTRDTTKMYTCLWRLDTGCGATLYLINLIHCIAPCWFWQSFDKAYAFSVTSLYCKSLKRGKISVPVDKPFNASGGKAKGRLFDTSRIHFTLKFWLSFLSLQLGGALAIEIKHAYSPVVFSILDPRCN